LYREQMGRVLLVVLGRAWILDGDAVVGVEVACPRPPRGYFWTQGPTWALGPPLCEGLWKPPVGALALGVFRGPAATKGAGRRH
jgi:hypothetical protein